MLMCNILGQQMPVPQSCGAIMSFISMPQKDQSQKYEEQVGTN